MDLSGGTSNPFSLGSGFFGSDQYDFAYTTDNTPPSGVATNGSQVQSGGSGFNWDLIGKGFTDVLGAFVQMDSNKTQLQAQTQPTMYRAPNGMLYPAGNATAQYQQTPFGMSPTMLLLGLAVVAIFLLKD